MKFKKIVGFGDSWMYGDELLDPDLLESDPSAHSCYTQNLDYRTSRCFLGLLGKHYQVPVDNFGIPGGSLTSIFWTFLWWLNHEPAPEECLVLVGLTNSHRITHYNPNHVHYSDDPEWNMFVHSCWINSTSQPSEFSDMMKQQLLLTDCEELRKLNYQTTVLGLDGIAARRGLKMIQFNIPSTPMEIDVPSLIWSDTNLTKIFLEHTDNQNNQLYMPGGHPNEKGHQIIRDMLIPEIDRVILS